MEFLNFNSVELLPNAKASAAFMVDSGKVFREDTDIAPYLDPRISFNEIDRYFFSGCACSYFQIAVDVFTDLRYNANEWA